MALFESTTWTGRKAQDIPMEAARLQSAPPKLKPRIDTNVMAEAAIAEYRAIAKEVGISDQDMMVEEFRLYLVKADLPTFNLQEVVAYMDDIAARDNPTKLGWHWCPVRKKDAETPLTFGRPSTQDYNYSDQRQKVVASSDFYESHTFQRTHMMQRHTPNPIDWREQRSAAYTRTLPLHALKKIARIEREFKGGAPIFLVTDYTTAPHVIVNPDPFLMAVIPNSAVAHGKGRFIIDVWDEPGFGIDRMVK
jgi:hypothetical protein